MRRQARGNRRGFQILVRSPRSRIVALRPLSYIRADSYTVDGTTGKVASFVDCALANHSLVQATSANQVALPASSALFGGKLSVTMATAMYISNFAASTFNALHLGAGAKVYFVCSTTSVAGAAYLLATSATTAAGWNIGRGATSFSCSLYNDAGTNIAAPTSGTLAVNTGMVLAASYIESGAPNEVMLRVSAQTAVGANTSAAPGTGNASAALRLGCRLTNNSPWTGELASVVIFDRLPTTSEDATIRKSLLDEYMVS